MFKSHFLSGEEKKSFYNVYSNKLTRDFLLNCLKFTKQIF